MTQDQIRADFESEAKARKLNTGKVSTRNSTEYLDDDVEEMWQVWQTACSKYSSKTPAMPDPVKAAQPYKDELRKSVKAFFLPHLEGVFAVVDQRLAAAQPSEVTMERLEQESLKKLHKKYPDQPPAVPDGWKVKDHGGGVLSVFSPDGRDTEVCWTHDPVLTDFLAAMVAAAQQQWPSWYGADTPWPLHDVLIALAAATQHLLEDHNCDRHGHEIWRLCEKRATEIVALIKNSRAPASKNAAQQEAIDVKPETLQDPADRFPDCTLECGGRSSYCKCAADQAADKERAARAAQQGGSQ